jgi:hypothetical protein
MKKYSNFIAFNGRPLAEKQNSQATPLTPIPHKNQIKTITSAMNPKDLRNSQSNSNAVFYNSNQHDKYNIENLNLMYLNTNNQKQNSIKTVVSTQQQQQQLHVVPSLPPQTPNSYDNRKKDSSSSSTASSSSSGSSSNCPSAYSVSTSATNEFTMSSRTSRNRHK